MTEEPKAWVWGHYQGVISDTHGAGSESEQTTNNRVVRFRTVQGSGEQAMSQKAADRRTKFGLVIACSILIGAFFPLIAIFSFLIAALLIASGRELERTEKFLGQVPGGDYIRKALIKFDELSA